MRAYIKLNRETMPGQCQTENSNTSADVIIQGCLLFCNKWKQNLGTSVLCSISEICAVIFKQSLTLFKVSNILRQILQNINYFFVKQNFYLRGNKRQKTLIGQYKAIFSNPLHFSADKKKTICIELKK
jgi:hypothetical protein